MNRQEKAYDNQSTERNAAAPLSGTGREVVIERPGDVAVVQLLEEDLQVNKRWAEAGAVLIRKRVETERESFPVDAGYEEVEVERVPVNRVLGDGERAVPRQEGDTLIVPVLEEELVVTKRLILREELHVTKRRISRQQEVSGEVKRERIEIETGGNLESVTRE